MGKGGAQLGKSLKGKTKPPEQQAQEEQKEIVAEVAEAQLEEDIKQLEEYERLAKIAEEHRLRLKKMAAEEALNTRLNRALLLNMQRKMMRTEKLETLKRDLQLLEQQYTQTAERKDSIIHLLSQDLDELHAQFEHAQRAHMGKMTKLLTLHNSRVRQLEADCERDLKELRLEFESEREQLLSSHARQVHELTSVINAVESEERRRADEARQAHETEREEIRNKNLEDINMLRIHLENKISDLERQFDEAHANYLQHTDAANKQFKKLVRKDKTLTKQIEAQKNRITRCQAKLALWKKTISQNEQECSERNQALRQQKELIAKHCQEMERKMKSQRSEESSQLSELSQWSRDALKANQERLAEAENIIKLAELTRKLETERETVAPFYESSVSDGELKSVAHEMNELRSQTATPAPGDDSSEYEGSKHGATTPNQWTLLENFYKRYNKALLDKLAIEQEKARLMGENSQLRTLIKQYLDGISVTAEAVDNANPLLIVNGRVNIAQDAQPVRRKVQPTTDAVMIVRAYAKQRV